MAKKPLTAAQINSLLKFKIDWIKDPVPEFRKYLDRASLTQIARAKKEFGEQINAIVKNRQQ